MSPSREAVGEEEAGALASDEAIRVSGLSQGGSGARRRRKGLSQGGWGPETRGTLALGKVRAAAAAVPSRPPPRAGPPIRARTARARGAAAAAGMLPRVASRSTISGFSADPAAPPPVAPPADPRAQAACEGRRGADPGGRWGEGRGCCPPPPATDLEARAIRGASGGRGGSKFVNDAAYSRTKSS